MKKIIFSVLLAILLVGCGQAEETEQEPVVSEDPTNTAQEEQNAQEEQKPQEEANTEQQIPLTLFKSDANAEYVEPFDVVYTGEEADLVRYIFEETAEFNVNLIDYTFENNEESLVLNLDDSIFNIQGSAGGTMFAGTLLHSYFTNFPELKEITFTHNGSSEEVLDHLMVGTPYTRDDMNTTTKPQ